MKKISSKNIIVTGGAKRLGKEICLFLAKKGYNIGFSYLTSEKEAILIENKIKKYNVNVFKYKADLTKVEDIKNFFSYSYQRFKNIDVLINNASIFYRTPIDSLNEEIFDKTINTNLRSYYLCSLEVVKYMSKKRGGKIINISSLGGEKPYKNYLPYSVSKAGVNMLTKCLALELAPNILVNGIAPGIIDFKNEPNSNFLPSVDKIPLMKYVSPDEITNFIYYLINSKYITGQVFLIDGGKILK